MPVHVRLMRSDDSAPVAGLCGELGYPSTPAEVAQRLQILLPLDNQRLLVAEDDEDGVVGWVHVQHALVLESGPWAEVAGLVVTERWRGRGVGRLLLEEAERWAAAHGHRAVRLRSNVIRKEAHEFYKRRGYQVLKTQLNFQKRLEHG
jgi:GNAT superfamily N-acetyltransferase